MLASKYALKIVFIERVAAPDCCWIEVFDLKSLALRYVFPGIKATVRDYTVLRQQNRVAGRRSCCGHVVVHNGGCKSAKAPF